MYLYNNKNLTLHPKAFYDLPSLKDLDLEETGITEIEAETLFNLIKENLGEIKRED